MVHYYIQADNNSKEHHTFAHVEDIAAFLNQVAQEEGEFFVSGFSGIKIQYNIKTGDVILVSAEEKTWITSFYAKEPFHNLISPIAEAISLHAKCDLLWHLDQLGDKKISDLIHHNHIDKNTGEKINIKQSYVDFTLLQIRRLTRPSVVRGFFKASQKNPVEDSVYQALVLYPPNCIKSQADVKHIMQEISKTGCQTSILNQNR